MYSVISKAVKGYGLFNTFPYTSIPIVPKTLVISTPRTLTSHWGNKRNRKTKLKRINPMLDAKFNAPRVFQLDPKMPKLPLAKTDHPVNPALECEEKKLNESVTSASEPDQPNFDMPDPYTKEERTCILCPKRYAIPIKVTWKNPKLLAQFVSPHTGLVYKNHVTGLCASMQAQVEKETLKAQNYGFLATKMKELHYLKDPVLFNPTRPMKRNPH